MAIDDTIYIGDSHTLRIAVFTPDGDAINLTGATARWRLARSAKTPLASIWVTKTTGGGLAFTVETVTNDDGESVASVYVANVTINPADTASIPPGVWYHELEVTDISGNHRTVKSGSVRLRRTLPAAA